VAGRLDVVATPIGNLGDLSARAREALASAELICAEDTRRSAQLLNAIGVSGRLISLHDYNEQSRIETLVQQLRSGKVIALVSDAGTPLLSDPGFALVRAAADAGVEIRSIPGPSALTAALSIAGLATDRFVFEGFPPSRQAERRAAFEIVFTCPACQRKSADRRGARTVDVAEARVRARFQAADDRRHASEHRAYAPQRAAHGRAP